MNPLYLYPAEANLLKSGKRGNDYRDAWKKLADITEKQAGKSGGGRPGKLYAAGRALLCMTVVLAALYVILEILFRVNPDLSRSAANGHRMHIVLVAAIAAPAVLCYITHEWLKDCILRHYLGEYRPVCENYGVETLRQIGTVIRKEHVTAAGQYVCLRCRRGCRYDQTVRTPDELFCPVCGGDTLVGRITGSLFDVCCNYQAELDTLPKE